MHNFPFLGIIHKSSIPKFFLIQLYCLNAWIFLNQLFYIISHLKQILYNIYKCLVVHYFFLVFQFLYIWLEKFVICNFILATASIIHFTSTVWTCTSIFGHHSGSDGSAYRNWTSWKKKFQTTQNKVAKMQKIALTRKRSHMISHYKNSLKHLLLTWTTATEFLQQWNWMHHSTLLVEVWSEKLICTLKL